MWNFFYIVLLWVIDKIGSLLIELGFKHAGDKIKKIIRKSEPSLPDKKHIVMVMRRSSFFGKAMVIQIRNKINNWADVKELESGEDIDEQVNNLMEAGKTKPDAIILFPVKNDPTLVREVLKLIESKIPVITVDRRLDPELFLVKSPYHVASDFHRGGQLAGEMMMKKLGHKGNIAIIAGPRDAEVSQIRLHAFIDEILKYVPAAQIVYCQYTNWSEDEGKVKAAEIMNMLQDGSVKSINGIFCCSDTLALGVAKVITAPSVIIIGYDGVDKVRDKIKERRIYGTINVKIEAQAVRLANELHKIFKMKGEYLNCYHNKELMGPESLTRSNLVQVNIEAIIFDFDGLMVENEDIQLDSFNQTLAQYEKVLTDDQFLGLKGKTQKEIFSEIKNKFGISESVENLIARKKEEYCKLIKGRLKRRVGLTELISWVNAQYLRKSIASSSPKEDIEATLQEIGLENEFDSESIFSSFELANGKPSPDIFLLAAQSLGVRPDNCIVLEDSPIGVQAAIRARMKCIAVPSSFAERPACKKAGAYVVDDLLEAKNQLEVWEKEFKQSK